jgi:hypothetical protein
MSIDCHSIGYKEPVRLVWTRSKKGARYNRCAISIHSFGLSIYEELHHGTYKNVWSDAVDDISYCVAEPLYRRIFAWISRSSRTNELECHVLLCKTSKRARYLAELLAKAFHDSYRYRQQRTIDVGSLTTRCTLCDTTSRQYSHDTHSMRSPLFRSHSHDEIEQNRSGMTNDCERVDIVHGPKVARGFIRNYTGNSIKSNSRRSIDNDTTLADEESIKPVEYYRE